MKQPRWGAGLMVVVLLVLASVGVGLAEDVGVITGSEKGTYYQFGLDLQKLVKPNGINVTVHPSKGSIENIFAVYQRPGVQLGIVQSDVLAFVARLQSDPVLTRIAKKTQDGLPALQRRGAHPRQARASPTSTTWPASGSPSGATAAEPT